MEDLTKSILDEVTKELSKALEEAVTLIREKEEKKIYTPEEVSRVLGISKTVVYNDLLKRKDFPCFNIGTRKYISKSGLDKWIEAQIKY